jgi:hypothetical protein
MDGLRSLAKKLEAGMKEIQRSAEVEARYAMVSVSVSVLVL